MRDPIFLDVAALLKLLPPSVRRNSCLRAAINLPLFIFIATNCLKELYVEGETAFSKTEPS